MFNCKVITKHEMDRIQRHFSDNFSIFTLNLINTRPNYAVFLTQSNIGLIFYIVAPTLGYWLLSIEHPIAMEISHLSWTK